MKSKHILAAGIFALTAASGWAAISIPTVTVGNPGNATDTSTGSLYGSVGYTYDIGKYDVTQVNTPPSSTLWRQQTPMGSTMRAWQRLETFRARAPVRASCVAAATVVTTIR